MVHSRLLRRCAASPGTPRRGEEIPIIVYCCVILMRAVKWPTCFDISLSAPVLCVLLFLAAAALVPPNQMTGREMMICPHQRQRGKRHEGFAEPRKRLAERDDKKNISFPPGLYRISPRPLPKFKGE